MHLCLLIIIPSYRRPTIAPYKLIRYTAYPGLCQPDQPQGSMIRYHNVLAQLLYILTILRHIAEKAKGLAYASQVIVLYFQAIVLEFGMLRLDIAV